MDISNITPNAYDLCDLGRAINLGFGGQFLVEPPHTEAQRVRDWWSQLSEEEKRFCPSLTQRRGTGPANTEMVNVQEIFSRRYGYRPDGKSDFVRVRVNVLHIQFNDDKPPVYNACTNPWENRLCNKAVKPDSTRQIEWQCPRCGDRSQPGMTEYRYLLNMKVADATGSVYVRAFDDVGKVCTRRGELIAWNDTTDLLPTESRTGDRR